MSLLKPSVLNDEIEMLEIMALATLIARVQELALEEAKELAAHAAEIFLSPDCLLSP